MVNEVWHRRHDIFNLIVLPFVIYANVNYLFLDRSAYWPLFWCFFGYLFLDTYWILIVPDCVASPTTIVIHHLLCLIGWCLPALFDQLYTDWISYGILVEFNTWFLIARRNFKDVPLISYLFYVSWVIIRLGMYPVIMISFSMHLYELYMKEHAIPSFGLIMLFFMVSLNILNIKWTYDMILKFLKGGIKEELEIKKGL